ADAAQQIDDRRPPLWIRARRDVAARLVQQQVPVLLDDLHPAAVDANVVARGIGLAAKLADRGAVHLHASVEHELLARAARGDSRVREDFLKALHTEGVSRTADGIKNLELRIWNSLSRLRSTHSKFQIPNS